MSAALQLQKAIRSTLAGNPGVLATCPAGNIIDSHKRPTSFPAVVMGEDLETDADLTFDRRHVTVYATLHLWHDEPGLTGVKAIAGAIRNAIRSGIRLDGSDRLVDLQFESARFIRDPDGLSHGVVTLEALVEEGAL
jgi:Protein of unknown function (DUF3168)